MRILAFSDWRVQNIEKLINFVKTLDEKPDIILYGGDDTNRFDRFRRIPYFQDGAIFFSENDTGSNKFEELAKLSKYGVFGVIGNECQRTDKRALKGENVYDLHEAPKEIGDYLFVGIEGATNDTEGQFGNVLYDEKDIKNHLEEQISRNKDKKIILLSHCPPKDTLDYAMRYSNGESIGSRAIREVIKNNNVILNVCGHCHLMGGRCQKFGKCTVLNIASHDNAGAKGKIATIDIDGENITIKIIELPNSNLEAIWGIGSNYASVLEKKGIRSISELAALSPRELSKIAKVSQKVTKDWNLRATLLLANQTMLLEKIVVNDPVFVDIETNHACDSIWMICIFDVNRNICKQFMADEKITEKNILKSFLSFISKQRYEKIYGYSGSDFEGRILSDRIAYYKLKNLLPTSEDLLYKIRKVLIIPLKTYGLKELGSFLGFEWKHPDIDGLYVPILYRKFLETKDKDEKKKLRKDFEEYNKDDVSALWHIVQKVSKMEIGKEYSNSELKKL